MNKVSFIYNKRVRYKEIDAMGIVYYSRYYEYFESARDEMLRDLGMSNRQLEQIGYYLPVIESHCEYKNGAKYNEMLAVKCTLSEISKVKIKINYTITGKEERLIAEGYTLHAFVDDEGNPCRVPEEFLELLDN